MAFSYLNRPQPFRPAIENMRGQDQSHMRTFDQNMNNKHTSSNTIHLAHCYHHLPDSFVHSKNFKNFTAHHGTTHISENDDES